MTTSEEKRLQNRKYQAAYRKRGGTAYRAAHKLRMREWRKKRRIERMERQGV